MTTQIAKPRQNAEAHEEGSLTARAFRSLVDAFEHATLFPDDPQRAARVRSDAPAAAAARPYEA